MSTTTGTRKRARRTPDDRFATVLRRLRWPVVIVWLLAIVLLNGLSSSLSTPGQACMSWRLRP